ncbi:alpha carbonic anhydrase 4 isoform X2 [Ricinus communis]|uniref:alpha carbonic anhydrase 4 isoform X2 n=1 Tax=Ricinus communis TaxID=3988 RepID=UPI00201AF7DD|nr:alpha carbonic anhydrase 4 isoform X2 [Ricinus communis]
MMKSYNFNVLLLIIVLCSLTLLSSASMSLETGDESPYLYREGTGKGPKEWGLINRRWRTCSNGKLQSPVNLSQQKVQVLPSLGKLKRDYQPAPATIKNRGHDITVRWKGNAGKIKVNGTIFKLLQCHWHSPSEHTFNGSRFELELHMVHFSPERKIAVVAIVYEYGRPDSFLSRLFHHIKSVGKEERNIGIINPGDIKFGSRKYYRYIGSLTVPPCTEGVIWTISKKGFKTNARPTQPSHERAIYLYSP